MASSENLNYEEKLWNKNFILSCIIAFFPALAMTMINSTMSKYIYSLFGNASFSGWLNFSFGTMAILARLVSGSLSDRVGRRLIIMVGAVIFAASVFCFGIFPYAPTLILFRALQGFGYSVTSTATNAAGADVLPEHRMSEGIGYLGMGYCISTAVGSAFALSLIRGDDFSGIFYATTAVIIATIILTLFLNYEKDPFYKNKLLQQKERSAAKDLSQYKGLSRFIEKKALTATSVQLFNSTAWAAVNAFIVIYADSRGFTGTAFFYMCVAIGMFISRLISGRLTDKYGEVPVAAPAIILNMIGFVLLIIVNHNVLFYCIGLLLGFVNGTVTPVMQAVSIKRSPPNRRGAASGTFQIANDIANGLGALIWGIVIDQLGYTAMFCGCIFSCCIALCLLVAFFRKRGEKIQTAE